ncbi:S8 family peptidase [Kitasatospora sp. CB01950]|uniref:S8 family peptidase n=1 Tax=Kitasatospora sp. CB01950 TaxID=1703930 RepID=UPI00093E9085|nr:S8 family serine peptidase [Kitasatospora sp. CB01950]OKJ02939.1 serine protease [Kitasatospora sp. CB01950]
MTTVPDAAPPRGLTWRLTDRTPADVRLEADALPERPAAGALVGGSGRGVRVCVVDSGVDGTHPLVGPVAGAHVVRKDADGTIRVDPLKADDPGDVCGHGTSCAGIVRRVAPDCEIHSVRVLGERRSGSGDVLLEGLRWAIRQGFEVINLSLSTTRARFFEDLHTLADEAYFGRSVIVASAHNSRVESFPWRFSSVVSVGSHLEEDPDLHLYNPEPPVEFFGPGANVEVAWLGGGTVRSSGNSYATPFVAGLCARVLSERPRLTPFQLKHALYLSAANVHLGGVR